VEGKLMRVFNKDKTQVLEEYDLNLGQLKEDKYYNIIPEVQEVKEEYHYEVIETFENGGQTVKRIIDVPGVAGKPQKIEEEDILIYIPYSEEELRTQKISRLRLIRNGRLLPAFDKWEKAVIRGRESDDNNIMGWYHDILDLKANAFLDENIPNKIKYYL
jgi:hypothetical protein